MIEIVMLVLKAKGILNEAEYQDISKIFERYETGELTYFQLTESINEAFKRKELAREVEEFERNNKSFFKEVELWQAEDQKYLSQ